MVLADLKRKPIVSMADGQKIGEVDDLLIDTASWHVRDVVIDSKKNRGLLPLASIKNIGPDAVTVEQADLVAWNAQGTGLAFEELKSLIVVDGSGTTLGHIKDLSYDAGGAIASLDIHNGGVLGIGVKVTPVTPAEIRGVGERLVTVEVVPKETEPLVTTPPSELPPE